MEPNNNNSHLRPPSPPTPKPVRRLTFSYEGDDIKLVSDQRVTMIVPSSQSLEKIESTPGFSVVLRDQSGTPVYRRVFDNPIRRDVEVFSPDPKQSIQRTPVEQSKGTFIILIPEIEGARTLELHGNPLHPRAHLEPPKLIARFMLTSTEASRG